jgi:hypothetical protein
VVNVAIRSIDVLNKMAKENSDTIFALREALILYDPKNILRSIEKDATLTEPIPVNLKKSSALHSGFQKSSYKPLPIIDEITVAITIITIVSGRITFQDTCAFLAR